MRKSARTLAVTVGVCALAVSACGSGGAGSGAPSGPPVDGQTFTMAIPSDPGSLDPDQTVMSVAIALNRFLYDSLVNLGPDGQPVAGLAAKWTGDTTTASFTLRPGITCADGAPLSSTDVAANINYVADPKNRSAMLGLLVTPGTTATASGDTVAVKSPTPDAFLVRNVGALPIVCAKGMADRGQLAHGSDGTGMFTLTEAVSNDHYTLTRRPGYHWGPGNWTTPQHGLPDKVVVKVVENLTTSANLLLSGGLNAAAITGDDRQRLLAQGVFHADFLRLMGEMFFNEDTGHPGADPAVRKALVQALDLGQIGKVLTNGAGQPSQGMITISPKPCSGDTVSGNLPTHDVTAAKAALDAAGWTVGAGGTRSKDGHQLALTVLYGTQLGKLMAAGAELVQQQWQAVGVAVTLKPADTPTTSQVLFGTGAYDVSLAPLGLTLASQLMPFVSGPTPPNGTNFAHIHNTGYEDLTRQAMAMPGATGCATWNSAESALVKAVDVVPFEDDVTPVFGRGARFTIDQGSIVPTSILMYAN